MPIREFDDAGGVRWRVWPTTPQRGNVRPQFASGWLAFESTDERRRLAPVPDAWADADDGTLCEFLAQATVVKRDTGALLDSIATGARGPEKSGVPPVLEGTLARVRAVMRAVDEALKRKPAG
jgi:hypothetical protein